MKAGDVVLVRFPFTDLSAPKKRPALVLAIAARSLRYRLVTVAMTTSQIEALKVDVLLADWKAAGLLHPSLLRLAKIATVDSDLIDKVAGKLSNSDTATVRKTFQFVFSTWLKAR